MTVSRVHGHQQRSVTVSAGNEGDSREAPRGTRGQGIGQRSTTTDGTYIILCMVWYKTTKMQGLFQDFASEGANAKFQNFRGGGGKYKAKEGQPYIKRTEKPIPRGGKRIPRGGQKHPLAPP